MISEVDCTRDYWENRVSEEVSREMIVRQPYRVTCLTGGRQQTHHYLPSLWEAAAWNSEKLIVPLPVQQITNNLYDRTLTASTGVPDNSPRFRLRNWATKPIHCLTTFISVYSSIVIAVRFCECLVMYISSFRLFRIINVNQKTYHFLLFLIWSNRQLYGANVHENLYSREQPTMDCLPHLSLATSMSV